MTRFAINKGSTRDERDFSWRDGNRFDNGTVPTFQTINRHPGGVDKRHSANAEHARDDAHDSTYPPLDPSQPGGASGIQLDRSPSGRHADSATLALPKPQ